MIHSSVSLCSQRFAKSPVTTAFLGLSKVHSMLMTAVDVLAPPLEDGVPHGAMEGNRMPDFQLPPISVLQTTSNDDQDFEVISIVSWRFASSCICYPEHLR